MEEILAELLGFLAELLLEVLLELAGEFILDLLLRALARMFERVFEAEEVANALLAGVWYAALGIVAGVRSIKVFPHPLVHPSRVHGISLLVAPVGTGFLMSLAGSLLSRKGVRTIRLESFGYGFAFAFGMALIRFLFAR